MTPRPGRGRPAHPWGEAILKASPTILRIVPVLTTGSAMCRTGDDGMMAREFGNVRFLIEQQLHIVDDLDRRGLDGRAARDLLRRLMRQDEDLRRRWAASGPRQVA